MTSFSPIKNFLRNKGKPFRSPFLKCRSLSRKNIEGRLIYSNSRFKDLTIKHFPDIDEAKVRAVLGFMEETLKDWKSDPTVPIVIIRNVGTFYFCLRDLSLLRQRWFRSLKMAYKEYRGLVRRLREGIVIKEKRINNVMYKYGRAKYNYERGLLLFECLIAYISDKKRDLRSARSWLKLKDLCGLEKEVIDIRRKYNSSWEAYKELKEWYRGKEFIGLDLDEEDKKRIRDITDKKYFNSQKQDYNEKKTESGKKSLRKFFNIFGYRRAY